jgi:hypothetical protein
MWNKWQIPESKDFTFEMTWKPMWYNINEPISVEIEIHILMV